MMVALTVQCAEVERKAVERRLSRGALPIVYVAPDGHHRHEYRPAPTPRHAGLPSVSRGAGRQIRLRKGDLIHRRACAARVNGGNAKLSFATIRTGRVMVDSAASRTTESTRAEDDLRTGPRA